MNNIATQEKTNTVFEALTKGTYIEFIESIKNEKDLNGIINQLPLFAKDTVSILKGEKNFSSDELLNFAVKISDEATKNLEAGKEMESAALFRDAQGILMYRQYQVETEKQNKKINPSQLNGR